MDRLYILITKSKLDDEKSISSLLQQFESSIKKSLYQTSYNHREDLNQELNIKILDAVRDYNFDKCPGFWEFIRLDAKQIGNSS